MRLFYFILLLFILIPSILEGQVGIGTNTPDNSALLEVQSTDRGILFPRMSTMQRTSISNPALGLHVFDTNTNSLWFYNGSFWVNYAAQSKYGDVKSGIHTLDHEGWVLLDGRATSSLSATQQAVASSLGFTGNLPNASNAYMVQNGATLGAVTGANTVTLTQANLPNVNFTGAATSSGDHTHTTDPAAFNSTSGGSHAHIVDPPNSTTSTNGWHQHSMSFNNDDWNGCCGGSASLEDDGGGWYSRWTDGNGNHNHTLDIPSFWSATDGNHAHTIDVPATTSSTNGAHTHSVSVSSGGAASPVNIAPQSMTVNMFIYLGL